MDKHSEKNNQEQLKMHMGEGGLKEKNVQTRTDDKTEINGNIFGWSISV